MVRSRCGDRRGRRGGGGTGGEPTGTGRCVVAPERAGALRLPRWPLTAPRGVAADREARTPTPDVECSWGGLILRACIRWSVVPHRSSYASRLPLLPARRCARRGRQGCRPRRQGRRPLHPRRQADRRVRDSSETGGTSRARAGEEGGEKGEETGGGGKGRSRRCIGFSGSYFVAGGGRLACRGWVRLARRGRVRLARPKAALLAT